VAQVADPVEENHDAITFRRVGHGGH
jgi:hypothetical protein